jgi:hypothetical protein
LSLTCAAFVAVCMTLLFMALGQTVCPPSSRWA